MAASSLSENYLAIETLEVLLRRVGASEENAKNAACSKGMFGGSCNINLNAVGGLVERSKKNEGRRRMGNLVSKLKSAKSGLKEDGKARVLHVLHALKDTNIAVQPGATLAALRAVRKQEMMTKMNDTSNVAPVPAPQAKQQLGGHVVPMTSFIRQGIYVMQGVSSDALPSDGPVHNAPHSACQIAAEQLHELGDVQARVKENLSAPKAGKSLLHQSLQHGIRTQMQSFDQSMGDLMAGVNTGMTLPRLLLAADKASVDLGFIRWVQLAAETSWAKGSALTGTLESFSHHAAAPPGLFKSLRDAAFKPLLHMISQWVTEGILDDPHEEFFISKAREKDVSPESDAWWGSKYTLRNAMLPPFVSRKLAEDILLSGKSIIFLRKLCSDPFHMPPSVKRLAQGGDGGVHPDNLAELVKAAKNAVNERVIEVIFDDHKLAEHLHVAKSLCMLGQGDFFDAIYSGRVGQMLRSDHSEVMKRKYQLIPAIEECIVKTQVGQGLSIDPCRYIDVRMQPDDEGLFGIDRFYLLYTCPQPLRTVLKANLVEAYYRPVFGFIWKVKRLLKDLVDGRRDFKQILHARCHKNMLKEPPSWWMKLHYASEASCHVTHAMLQFVAALDSYIMIDGVDVLWKEFEEKAKAAETFDTIISLHQETVIKLHRHALLDGQYLELRQCVESVLGVISHFLAQSSKLHQIGQSMLLRLQDEVDVSKSAGSSSWGVPKGPSSSSVLQIEEIGLAVKNLRRTYIGEVGHLLATLDRGLDPAKVARESTALSHANLSPKRVAALKARTTVPKLSMGSLQRLRTALDFNKYFQSQHDISTAQLVAGQVDAMSM
eukprot:TRINITY_DN19304_c0_g1_i2.p1 TRINITY_DN19304_c0_g1~~TRINITY_DN19304_c0_g1_i2.p1  ORF type:complete len:829 (+),score=214.76 TRINITY_DN19304_c0_g1_i2:49-2535(+)